jgi:hypothetical protein
MMSDHLAYWLLGAYPPTRLSTHPSVLTKPDIITAVEGPHATPDTELGKDPGGAAGVCRQAAIGRLSLGLARGRARAGESARSRLRARYRHCRPTGLSAQG